MFFVSFVLFICKVLTHLRPKALRHCSLARHFKTDPTETVALCFGYSKTPCLRAEGKLSSKQMNRTFVCLAWYNKQTTNIYWIFSFYNIFIAIIYITILLGVMLVRSAPTTFHIYDVDDFT
jgi:hypothetical protein